jgi:hypothetical protein
VPVWPARTVVLIGAVLVVTSYAMIGLSAVRALISGREDDTASPASTHI